MNYFNDLEYILTRQDTVALTVTAGAGLLSLLAVSVILGRIAVSAFRCSKLVQPNSRWSLIEAPMDLYLLSLFVADFILAIAMVLTVYWLWTGKVIDETFCNIQGLVATIGVLGVVLTNLAIAIHTFVVVWWRMGIHSLFGTKLVIAMVWTYILAMSLTRLATQIEGVPIPLPLPHRCWLAPGSFMLLFFGVTVLHWITLIITVFVYLALYLCSQGIIARDDETMWRFRIVRMNHRNPTEERIHPMTLLMHPLGIIVFYIPVVVRTLILLDPATKSLMAAIYSLCGLYDVVTFLYTRQGLLVPRVYSQEQHLEMGSLPSNVGSWVLENPIPNYSEGSKQ